MIIAFIQRENPSENLPRSCVGLPMTRISFGSSDRHPVSMARISWLKFKTAISLLASAHDKRLFDSLNFLYGLCKITLSVLVTAVRHTWMPSYFPNFTLPTKIRFKLNENAGFIENDISIDVFFSKKFDSFSSPNWIFTQSNWTQKLLSKSVCTKFWNKYHGYGSFSIFLLYCIDQLNQQFISFILLIKNKGPSFIHKFVQFIMVFETKPLNFASTGNIQSI